MTPRVYYYSPMTLCTVVVVTITISTPFAAASPKIEGSEQQFIRLADLHASSAPSCFDPLYQEWRRAASFLTLSSSPLPAIALVTINVLEKKSGMLPNARLERLHQARPFNPPTPTSSFQ
ncbi:hypothetical protein E2C01_051158 [Portunus trituberculatus]|uniref:Uncharacterized protein n=1 Tax=Portunus trituberculatus TaxID=210409 RepID=A0A5B7GIB4_PORTR|nr:hypothetical protein [Portunus trituberculatus]